MMGVVQFNKVSHDGQNEQKSTIAVVARKVAQTYRGRLTMNDSDDGQNEQKSTLCGGGSKVAQPVLNVSY